MSEKIIVKWNFTGTAEDRESYSVAYLPFWRWAVCVAERPDLAAIPFYRKASAMRFAHEASLGLPGRTIEVLKRLLRGVHVVCEMRGGEEKMSHSQGIIHEGVPSDPVDGCPKRKYPHDHVLCRMDRRMRAVTKEGKTIALPFSVVSYTDEQWHDFVRDHELPEDATAAMIDRYGHVSVFK